MKNKYLDKIGIKTSKNNVFGGGDTKDKPRYKKQREKYGFDARETWNLNLTSAAWLYSHLKMFLKEAGEIIDLTVHKFDIPVLYPSDKKHYTEKDKKWFDEKIENHTQLECIEQCIKYLEEYLIMYHKLYDEDFEFMKDELNESAKREGKADEMLQTAFKIYSIIIPAMWW